MAIFNNIQGLEGIEFSLRIWDMYLLHGEPILYCVALVILRVKLYKLNNAPMQSWLDFFSRIKKIKIPAQSHIYQVGHDHDVGQGGELDQDRDVINNQNSKMLIPLTQQIIGIFYAYDVTSLFKEHETQQLVAEQKNEVFTKMYLNKNNDTFWV